jgi:homoserine dehydrogenase
VYPLIKSFDVSTADALRTYVAHIAEQVKQAVAANGKLVTTNQQTTGHRRRRVQYVFDGTVAGCAPPVFH